MNKRVPEGWVKIKLGEIGKFSTSSVDKKSSKGEREVSLLNYMDVYCHSTLTENYPFQKVTAPSKQILSSSVRRGDVFFTPSSETPDDIGCSSVFIGDVKDIVHSYHTVRFRPSSNEYLDDNFKSYAFKGTDTFEYFRKRASGTTRFTLSIPVFNELELTVPPLQEQKKIASILTSVDEVIEKIQLQIDKLQNLKKATMNELLTHRIGRTKFKNNLCIKEFSKLFAGGTPSTIKPEYWEGGTIPWLSSGEIHKSRIKYADRNITELGFRNSAARLFSAKTILIALAGQGKTRGTVAITEIETTTNQSVAGLIVDKNKCIPDFLYFNLQSRYEELRSISGGAGRAGLNLQILGDVEVTLPSLAEQQKIVSILTSIDKVIEKIQSRLKKTKSLKKSLMQDLLTGKVRVSVN